jgi:2-polyprenyl-3-methyl-5-hydroxy-6-metoxy-1,4-benzoquinol methylase
LVKRKALVTALWECNACALRFRVPKGTLEEADRFYQTAYSEGFTTEMPSASQLADLLSRSFRSTEKDYSRYIDVLGALGLSAGNSILDFGCSWGYGSWQLEKAGFRVHSYEVSRPRAEYARTRLGCHVVNSLTDLLDPVDCLFAAHVIEHLPDPNVIWRAAEQVLRRSGVLVCFAPNGNPELEVVYGKTTYHRLWGQVHPLLLTPRAVIAMAQRYGYRYLVQSADCDRPYNLDALRAGRQLDSLLGSELLLAARRA